jgi:tRNA nucleotidyltransferase (CCA-adding enzyme)
MDRLLSRILGSAGVFAVGGRVRDELVAELGGPKPDHVDLDYLVTGIPMTELLASLSRAGTAELVGASFGVVKFATDFGKADIALPRRERSTGTHHRDFEVIADPSIPIEEDLGRRDFRLNMLARNIRTGELVDPYDGLADLKAKRLDIVRDETFVEDPLRILRAAHFTARFDLTPTARAVNSMRDAIALVSTVAQQRVSEELSKLFVRSAKPSLGLELLRDVGALDLILPELMEGWGMEQNEYHKYSVYFHNVKCCDESKRTLAHRLAGLFHDVGKSRTKDGPHFYGHDIVGEAMTRSALARLSFPNDLARDAAHLVRHHMYAADDRLTDAAIRRFVRRVGVTHVEALFDLRAADVAASGLPPRDPDVARRFEARVRATIEARAPFGLADLRIDGGDIIAIMRAEHVVDADFDGDKRVGETLAYCLEKVLDDPALNDGHALNAVARDFIVSNYAGAHKAT